MFRAYVRRRGSIRPTDRTQLEPLFLIIKESRLGEFKETSTVCEASGWRERPRIWSNPTPRIEISHNGTRVMGVKMGVYTERCLQQYLNKCTTVSVQQGISPILTLFVEILCASGGSDFRLPWLGMQCIWQCLSTSSRSRHCVRDATSSPISSIYAIYADRVVRNLYTWSASQYNYMPTYLQKGIMRPSPPITSLVVLWEISIHDQRLNASLHWHYIPLSFSIVASCTWVIRFPSRRHCRNRYPPLTHFQIWFSAIGHYHQGLRASLQGR